MGKEKRKSTWVKTTKLRIEKALYEKCLTVKSQVRQQLDGVKKTNKSARFSLDIEYFWLFACQVALIK